MVKQGSLYIPERGYIVYRNFDPTKGHEQRGLRPALVISPLEYNRRSSLALLLPITKQQKGYPFEVILPTDITTQGVVLADQIKCLDWNERGVRFVESAPDSLVEPDSVVEEVQGKLESLLL